MNKKLLIIIAVSLAVLGVVALVVVSDQNAGIFSPPAPTGAQPTPIPPEFAPVPPNVEVLEKGEKTTNRDIAVPVSVTPSTTDPNAKVRTFSIRASNNVFDPNTIVVNVGDTVIIKFTAVGKAYDLTSPMLNLKISAKKGETKTGKFEATTEGKYLFYCDLCGGQNSSTNGYIIIVPKETN